MILEKKDFVRALLASLLMVLAFPPIGLWPLAFVSAFFLVSFFYHEKNFKKLFSFLGTFVFFTNLGGFYWLAYTFKEFGSLSYFVAIPLMLFIFLLLGLFTVPFVFFFYKCRKWLESKAYPADCFYVLLFTVFFLWDRFEFRFFPWAVPMAVGQDTYLMSTVGLIGHSGWIFIFWFFVCLLVYINQKFLFPIKAYCWAGTICIFFACLYALGLYQKKHLSEEYSGRQPVVLLQGNVGNYEKKLTKLGVVPSVENVMNIHRDLIEKAAILVSDAVTEKGLEPWIFWPETSFPGYPISDPFRNQDMMEWVRLTRGIHFVGAYHLGEQSFQGRQISLDFNIVAMFHEKVGLVDYYKKQMLLPFGEFLPFDEHIPDAYERFPQVNHFGRGLEAKLLVHPDPKGPVFIPLVCYEILFPSLISQFIKVAQTQYPGRDMIIVNPTNDSWYGASSEPFQHSLLARWRSALFQLPMLRPTNTGFSQVVAPWGEVLATAPRDETTLVVGEVPVRRTIFRQ